ncbi:hypothetical protein CROQUDRAFT_129814 [Cronartium quercuum f. sp. fusiforme G11]|uniref:Uncharacterized protein n=1 Tax=Cronartium quercuum f. sp. fusiforme G11 TaxID=708437 RepID=A0A9P6NQT0_9BASI|nr:hypothetical protein CROQUDRAFT_129814 [Cronartium quercuum f. sp. fusiforme G11]
MNTITKKRNSKFTCFVILSLFVTIKSQVMGAPMDFCCYSFGKASDVAETKMKHTLFRLEILPPHLQTMGSDSTEQPNIIRVPDGNKDRVKKSVEDNTLGSESSSPPHMPSPPTLSDCESTNVQKFHTDENIDRDSTDQFLINLLSEISENPKKISVFEAKGVDSRKRKVEFIENFPDDITEAILQNLASKVEGLKSENMLAQEGKLEEMYQMWTADMHLDFFGKVEFKKAVQHFIQGDDYGEKEVAARDVTHASICSYAVQTFPQFLQTMFIHHGIYRAGDRIKLLNDFAKLITPKHSGITTPLDSNVAEKSLELISRLVQETEEAIRKHSKALTLELESETWKPSSQDEEDVNTQISRVNSDYANRVWTIWK